MLAALDIQMNFLFSDFYTYYIPIQNANLVFINLVLAVFSATQVESRGQLLLHAPSGCGHFKILATSLDIYLVMGYGYPNMEFRVLEVISFHFIKGMLNKDFLHFFII